MIPDSFKQELLSRVDIVDVIDSRVPLRKAGANLTACCPFHTEKTPSFTVSPAKQFYHCFGCGAHGNAITFLMEYGGLGYVDAVRELAESVGMKMPAFEPARAKPEAGPDLYELMDTAAAYYREQLKISPRAIEYLKGRGVSGRTAARYGMGYAPDGWQNLELVFPNYADKALRECGLVIENEAGRRYDRFRDRVMFPILDQRGRTIGFGGRVIGDGEPKYLNSPETPLFEKGRELYGLLQARDALRRTGRVIVVEGYMDVVMLGQHGVENAVATLGTSTTPTHVQKLLRLVDEVVFCFDGDAAGRKAAWHALEVSLPLLADNKAIRFLFLPADHDPDTYVRDCGAEAFEALAANAEPLSAYLLAELRRRADVSTPEGRAKLMHEAKPLVAKVGAPGLRVQLWKSVSALAGMTADESARVFKVPFQGRSPEQTPRPARPSARTAPSLARALLRCLIANPALAAELPDAALPGDLEGRALGALAPLCTEAGVGLHGILMERFRGSEYESLMAELLADYLVFNLSEEEASAEFRDAVRKLEINAIRRQIKDMEARLGELDSSGRRAYSELIQREAALRQALPAPSQVL